MLYKVRKKPDISGSPPRVLKTPHGPRNGYSTLGRPTLLALLEDRDREIKHLEQKLALGTELLKEAAIAVRRKPKLDTIFRTIVNATAFFCFIWLVREAVIRML